MPPSGRIPVSVLGATGSVGQRFVALLADHPWFELAALAASVRSEGRSYGEAVRWILPTPLPDEIARMPVASPDPDLDGRIAFSALPAEVAGPVERALAEAGRLVVTNTSVHRMEPSVPLLVPEVNPEHLDLLGSQNFGRGGIIANPNCSTIGLCLALKPIHDAFGVRSARVVTLQALSGAGLPGHSSLEALDNVIPYIAGEEQKLERETQKILGPVDVSAQCNRVPVLDGHTLCVSVALEREATAEGLAQAWNGFRSVPQELGLPSAPERPVCYLDAPSAPQPRLHRDLGNGMVVSVGRLQPCPLADWKFVTLSHNTIRGAAGGAILAAELAVARGYVADGASSS